MGDEEFQTPPTVYSINRNTERKGQKPWVCKKSVDDAVSLVKVHVSESDRSSALALALALVLLDFSPLCVFSMSMSPQIACLGDCIVTLVAFV